MKYKKILAGLIAGVMVFSGIFTESVALVKDLFDSSFTAEADTISDYSSDAESIIERTSSDYGYMDLAKRSNGEKKQELYSYLLNVFSEFYNSDIDITANDNGQYVLLEIELSDYNLAPMEIVEVYHTFINDNPIFYFKSNNIAFSDEKVYLIIDETYSSGEYRKECNSNIEAYIKSFDEWIQAESEYEICLSIHNYLIDTIEYAYESDGVTPEDACWAHNIIGAIDNKSGVCEAYARTYQMLLNYYNIENMVISGIANDENHIWNLVKLDDEKYYYIDCTWNDINGYFDYFCVGSDFFDIEHTKNSLENGSYDYLYELPEISTSDYKYPYEEYIVDGIKYNIYFEREAVVMGDTLNQSSIIIPDFVENKKVVSIDGAAFCQNENLESITLSSNIRDIKNGGYADFGEITGAFANCTNLKAVNIPEDSKLVYIGEWSFYNCGKLETILLPESIRILGLSCFEECTSLKELDLPEGLTDICQNAISSTGITSLKLPSTLTNFNPYNDLYELEEFESSENNPVFKAIDGVLYSNLLGDWQIYQYPAQKKDALFTPPDFLKEVDGYTLCNDYLECIDIGDRKFTYQSEYGDSYLRIKCEIKVSDDNPYYSSENGMLFNKEKTKLLRVPVYVSELTIPDTVDTIAACSCEGASFSEVIIPDTVKNIDALAFSKNTQLTYIELPKEIQNFGHSVFSDCTSLEKVIINSELSNMEATFSGCTNLKEIIIGEGVERIGRFMLSGCTSLTNVDVSDTVKSIDEYAFQNCISLNNITIPDSVTSIGNYAFYCCYELKSIDLSENIESIGDEAFFNCNNLANIIIPRNVTRIGNGTFKECDSIENITIPESVTYIGQYAFCNCDNLKTITIENSECEIYDDYNTIFDYAVICGYKNSTAQSYAENYLRKYSVIGSGDANSDGVTTVADLVHIQMGLVNNSVSISVIDINGDGRFNVFDVILIRRMIIYN